MLIAVLFAGGVSAQGPDWEQILDTIRPSLVRLETQTGEPVGMGSVLARPDFVVTTGQPWETGDTFMAVTHDGLRIDVTVIAYYTSRDLILLQGSEALGPPMHGGITRNISAESPVTAVSLLEEGAPVMTSGRVTAAENARGGTAVILVDFSTANGLLGAPVFDEQGRFAGLVAGRRIDIPDTIVVALNEIGVLIDQYRNVPSETTAGLLPAMDVPPNADSEEAESVLTFNRGVAADTVHLQIYHFQRATALRPGFYEAWYNLGVTQKAEGNNEQALAALETAWSLQPDSAPAARALGDLAMSMQMWDRAKDALATAVSLEPDQPRLRNALGEALLMHGDFEASVPHFEQTLQQSPDYTPALYNLAYVYRQLGRSEEAAPLYERYLEHAPHGEHAEQARAALGRGGAEGGDSG